MILLSVKCSPRSPAIDVTAICAKGVAEILRSQLPGIPTCTMCTAILCWKGELRRPPWIITGNAWPKCL